MKGVATCSGTSGSLRYPLLEGYSCGSCARALFGALRRRYAPFTRARAFTNLILNTKCRVSRRQPIQYSARGTPKGTPKGNPRGVPPLHRVPQWALWARPREGRSPNAVRSTRGEAPTRGAWKRKCEAQKEQAQRTRAEPPPEGTLRGRALLPNAPVGALGKAQRGAKPQHAERGKQSAKHKKSEAKETRSVTPRREALHQDAERYMTCTCACPTEGQEGRRRGISMYACISMWYHMHKHGVHKKGCTNRPPEVWTRWPVGSACSTTRGTAYQALAYPRCTRQHVVLYNNTRAHVCLHRTYHVCTHATHVVSCVHSIA